MKQGISTPPATNGAGNNGLNGLDKRTQAQTTEPSPLSNLDIVCAIQSRLAKLYAITQVTSNTELGVHTHMVQSHLSMAAHSLVDELQILTEELAERL